MRYNVMFDTLKNLTNESLTDRRMMSAFGLNIRIIKTAIMAVIAVLRIILLSLIYTTF